MAGFGQGGTDDLRIGRSLDEERTPCLVLDLDVLERNLRRMALRMRKLGTKLRPHYKTHKSQEICQTQAELGGPGFTVSTLDEAEDLLYGELLADGRSVDVLWAYPLIPSRLDHVVQVARSAHGVLRLAIDSPEAVEWLERRVAPHVSSTHVWLEVAAGYARSGVEPASEHAVHLARRLADSDFLVFDGIFSHSGHAYARPGREALRAAAEEERSTMVDFAARLRDGGVEVPRVSIGSTPAMSVIHELPAVRENGLEGISEVRPGNYCFYDYTQVLLGSCGVEDCALTVVSSVISCQPGAGRSVIDAGALELSKDPGPPWMDPPGFGRIFADYAAHELDDDARVVSLSQEHGVVDAPFGVGTRLRVLPNHSCLVVPNFLSYVVVRGEEIVDVGSIGR